jgi:hypothetical protein
MGRAVVLGPPPERLAILTAILILLVALLTALTRLPALLFAPATVALIPLGLLIPLVPLPPLVLLAAALALLPLVRALSLALVSLTLILLISHWFSFWHLGLRGHRCKTCASSISRKRSDSIETIRFPNQHVES